MAKATTANKHTPLHKRTSQGGKKVKTSTMSKTKRRNHKGYRGQGR